MIKEGIIISQILLGDASKTIVTGRFTMKASPPITFKRSLFITKSWLMSNKESS